MKFFQVTATLVLFFVTDQSAFAVPISWLNEPTGNQRDVEWKRLESSRFSVYYDEKAQPLAHYALTSVENAYPDLSFLLGVKLPSDSPPAIPGKTYITSKFDRIPVALNSRSDAASFANPVTNNLEVKSGTGRAPSALYSHELTHRLMYEHLDPGIGVAGRGFTLAIMPTWWIEGLAEYLTESQGRLETQGLMRTTAANNAYLNWDRIHSLYQVSGDLGYRGYAESGQFFKYLIENAKGASLSEIHKDFFYKSLTPPFVNATNRVLNKFWEKSGPDLYEEFKQAQKKYWTSSLEGMPPLVGSDLTKDTINASWPQSVVFSDGLQIVSDLTRSKIRSGLSFIKTGGDRWIFRPLDLEGSAVFDIHPAELNNGGFWTRKWEKYSNGTSGSQLLYVKFNGALTEIDDSKIHVKNTIQISNKGNPITVSEIRAMGQGKAFAIGDLHGESYLFLIDGEQKSASILRKWSVPVSVKFLGAQRSAKHLEKEICVNLIVDGDRERTELEKVCADGKKTTVMPPGKAYIRSGFQRSNGSFLFVVGWDNVLGIAEFKNAVLTPIAPFPEWGDALIPWGETDDAAFWHYTFENRKTRSRSGSGYYALEHFSPKKLSESYKTWAKNLPVGSSWKNYPGWKPYTPPYVTYANAERERLLKTRVSTSVGKKDPFVTLEDRKISYSDGPADYRNSHLFTYPIVVPPPFGEWTLGIVSVPFVDELERHRVQLFASYNFLTRGVGATATYLNSRVLDGIQFSLFTRERFNGLYYLNPIYDGTGEQARNELNELQYSAGNYPDKNAFSYYSYLREEGGEVSVDWINRPTSLSLGLKTSLAKISPSSGTRSSFVGAQNAYLGSVGIDASSSLFNFTFFHETDEKSHDGNYLDWNAAMSVSDNWHQSIGKVSSGFGREMPDLKFNRVSGSLTSGISYLGHTVSFRSRASGTLGKHTLNLKEIYQPYQTYLLGSGSGLNSQNFAIINSGRLFARGNGVWSYRNSVDYRFPLITGINKQFLITYLDSLQGEVVLGRGGLARKEDFTDLHSMTSVSTAIRLNIDIKGFGIYPSLAYGKIIGEKGWSLFTEVAFSAFL